MTSPSEALTGLRVDVHGHDSATIGDSLLSAVLALAGCATLGGGASRLDQIRNRGETALRRQRQDSRFSFLQRDGRYAGLDVDLCKAFAAAFVGDGDKVQYRPLTAPERFTALRTGEIDLLSRNTTFNLSRDAAGGNGVSFAPVVFHDGQGLLVRRDSGIRSLEISGTDHLRGLRHHHRTEPQRAFQARGLPYTLIKYQDLNQVVAGYLQGRCSAFTSDRSQLASARSGFERPDDT